MSKQEFSRLDVLLRVQSGRLRVGDACVLIGLERRQVFRLLRGLKQDGATSLLSKRRGKPSNHRLPAEVRTLALSNSARVRTSAGSRWLLGLPRRLESRLVAPSCLSPRSSRNTCRRSKPISTQASPTRRRPD